MMVQIFSRFCVQEVSKGKRRNAYMRTWTYHKSNSYVLGVVHHAADRVDALREGPLLGLADVREDVGVEDGGFEAGGMKRLYEIL
jgi:hypothetical protein